MKIKIYENPSDVNPCISCGACCCYFRVEFYWREAEKNSEHQVPQQFTEDLNSFKRCMKGTLNKSGNRCVALSGKIGKRVGCTIYANRPSPCRNFQYSYADGKPNKRCDEARAAQGLKPLPRPESLQHQVHPLTERQNLTETDRPSQNSLDAPIELD